jgi:capsule polysaccharide export protein KpsE/RkpR
MRRREQLRPWKIPDGKPAPEAKGTAGKKQHILKLIKERRRQKAPSDKESKPHKPGKPPEKSREEVDMELVQSMRGEIALVEDVLEKLGSMKDISGLKAEADSLRRTLNLGQALGQKALMKARRRLDRLEAKAAAAGATNTNKNKKQNIEVEE